METQPTGPERYDGFWRWIPTHGILRLDYRWNVSIICRQGVGGCFQTTKTHIILEPPRFRHCGDQVGNGFCGERGEVDVFESYGW